MPAHSQTKRPPATTDQHGDMYAYSLAEFCRPHGISLQLYYKLAQQGLAPKTFYVGSRVLISKEAAARWRRARERKPTEG